MPHEASGDAQRGEHLILRSRLVSVSLLAGWLLLGTLPTAAYASDTAPEDAKILGYWQRGEGEAIIEVRRQADGYHGVIVDGENRRVYGTLV